MNLAAHVDVARNNRSVQNAVFVHGTSSLGVGSGSLRLSSALFQVLPSDEALLNCLRTQRFPRKTSAGSGRVPPNGSEPPTRPACLLGGRGRGPSLYQGFSVAQSQLW